MNFRTKPGNVVISFIFFLALMTGLLMTPPNLLQARAGEIGVAAKSWERIDNNFPVKPSSGFLWNSPAGNSYMGVCDASSKNRLYKYNDDDTFTELGFMEDGPICAIGGVSDDLIYFGTQYTGILQARIWLYDGSSFTPMERDYNFDVNAFWTSETGDSFAVGGSGHIQRYDPAEKKWKEMVSNTTNYLYDIWGTDSNNIYAVGYNKTIIHYNGSEWLPMESPATVTNVWGLSGTDIYACGRNTILHYNGTSWEVVPTGIETYIHLSDMTGLAPDNVYAVGVNDDEWIGAVVHYNGTAWENVEIPEYETCFRSSIFTRSGDLLVCGVNEFILLKYSGEPAPPGYTLTTTVDPAGSGTVELDPPGGAYPAGTEVTLTANPAAGYAFDHWSGDLSGNDNPATITMDTDKSVIAHFVPALPDLTITALNLPADVYKGSPVTVNANVYNIGKAGAENFSVALYVYAGGTPTLVDTKSVSSLAYGSGTDVDFTWTPAAAGQVTLKAVADSANAVAESDETNNEKTKEVSVTENVTEKSLMRISPADKTVTVGETFTLDVVVTPAVAIAGAQFDLSFDPAIVEVTGVTEGNLFKQGGAGTYFRAGVIDNPNGKLTGVAVAITTPGAEVSDPGTFATVAFKAKAQGSTNLTLSKVVVGNKAGQAVAVAVTGGGVTVTGAPAVNKPDLMIQQITTPAAIYANEAATVTATVYNTGNAAAGSFEAALYAGETLVGEKPVTSLAAGASTEVNFTWTPSAAGQVTLKAVADSANAVAESDETNNEKTKEVTVTTRPAGGGGSGGGGGAAPATGETVTSTGGTVSKSGATITIPAGAVAGDVKVKIEKAAGTLNLPVPANSKLVSEVFEITKNKSGDFAKPVTITLSFDRSRVDAGKHSVSLYWFDESAQKWVELANIKVDLAAGTVSGEVNHFTKFAVIAAEKATQAPPAQAPPVTLKDIAGHWAREVIEFMADKGFLKGYPDGTCRPDNPVTRAEFAAFLVRVLGLQEAASEVTFTDVQPGDWHYRVIATAFRHGLVKGYSAGAFGPGDPVTREQVAAMLTRALAAKGISVELNEAQTAELLGRFSDAGEISAWAKTSVAAAANQQLVNGYPDQTFKPQNTATRAEVATMLKRLYEK